jgi:hypothetical protein
MKECWKKCPCFNEFLCGDKPEYLREYPYPRPFVSRLSDCDSFMANMTVARAGFEQYLYALEKDTKESAEN